MVGESIHLDWWTTARGPYSATALPPDSQGGTPVAWFGRALIDPVLNGMCPRLARRRTGDDPPGRVESGIDDDK